MNKRMKILSLLLAGSIVMGTGLVYTEAAQRQKSNGPVAGVSGIFVDMVSDADIDTVKISENVEVNEPVVAAEETEAEVAENEVPVTASEYTDIAIAQVNNYVNVRAMPNTESEILGKLYHNSAASVLETTEDGWHRIQSGNVSGYVKAEYVVVGNEELARAVSTRYATVTTTTLFVRSEPTTEASVLTMLPEGDDLEVLDESIEGWVKVSTVEGEGYVSREYVSLSTEYVEAESKEEEERRLAQEEAERKAAAEAAEKARAEAAKKAQAEAAQKKAEQKAANSASVQNKENTQVENKVPSAGVSNGQAVVDYARQFLGNPYVYGGTSLTNGADCSGFVQSVYKAFGVSLPRNSAAQRGAGYAVSLDQIQPGDLVCYSGHIGIYAGNNTLIHASNERTGITLTSPITYRKILAVRRIF